jgi:hypothetical protein
VLWRAVTAQTSVELPRSVPLEPGVVYFSRVLALDAEGRVVAASERVGFQIEPPRPEAPEVMP